MKTLIRTVLSVFPHVSVWWAPNFNNKHAILIGMNHPISIDFPALYKEFSKPEIRASLDEAALGRLSNVLGSFVADETALRAYAGDGPLNTDDNLLLPYGIPKNELKADQTVVGNLEALGRLGMSIVPYMHNLSEADRAAAGLDAYYAALPHVANAMKTYYAEKERGTEADFSQAAKGYETALEINPGDPAVEWLLTETKFFVALSAAHKLQKEGRYEAALEQYRGAVAIQPYSPSVYNAMAFCYAALNDRDGTIASLRKAVDLAPDFVVGLNNLALFYFRNGDLNGARETIAKALASSPYNADARRLARMIERGS
jgi:tetratricopeptide (TPR) repeat protein